MYYDQYEIIKAPIIFPMPDNSSNYVQPIHNTIMFICITITYTAQKERERFGHAIISQYCYTRDRYSDFT